MIGSIFQVTYSDSTDWSTEWIAVGSIKHSASQFEELCSKNLIRICPNTKLS